MSRRRYFPPFKGKDDADRIAHHVATIRPKAATLYKLFPNSKKHREKTDALVAKLFAKLENREQ